MNFPVKSKKALKFIKEQAKQLTPAKYSYNVYGLVDIPGIGKVETKLGEERHDVSHERRMWRKYKRSLKVSNPKLKTSKRQERLSKIK